MNTHLTQREKQILQLLATGLKNKEISLKLSIQEATVENHIHSIYKKREWRKEGVKYRL